MGLLSFLFKTPEQIEQKGDGYFAAGEFGAAKIEYEKALDGIIKKHPDDIAMKERVQDKLIQSKETLAAQHTENADNLVEAGVLDEARDLYTLALKLSENRELAKQLKEKLVSLGSSVAVEYEPEEEGNERHDVPDDEVSDSDEFNILCATLPGELAGEYASYGDTFVKGYLSLSRGEFETAVELLEHALEEQSEPGSYVRYELATALVNIGRSEEAMVFLNEFVEARRDSIQGISLLCELYCEKKMYDKAHTLIDTSPETIQNTLGSYLNKGNIYCLEGKYDEAETLYRTFLENNEWDDSVSRALAETLEGSGKLEEARDEFANLLNRCTGCGRRPQPYDRKKFADLSFELKDYTEKNIEVYLALAKEYAEFKSECYSKVSTIYRALGNEHEALRYEKLI